MSHHGHEHHEPTMPLPETLQQWNQPTVEVPRMEKTVEMPRQVDPSPWASGPGLDEGPAAPDVPAPPYASAPVPPPAPPYAPAAPAPTPAPPLPWEQHTPVVPAGQPWGDPQPWAQPQPLGGPSFGSQPGPSGQPAQPWGQFGGFPAAYAPYGIDPTTGIPYSDKSKVVAGLLQIFLGYLGVGRFYLGDIGIAIAQIAVTFFTFGLGGIWPLIDGIVLLAGDPRDHDGRPLRG